MSELSRRVKVKDSIFQKSMSYSAFIIILLLISIFITLLIESMPSIKAFGFHFVVSKTWSPVFNIFGALPFMIGTVVTSFLSLAISFPFSMAIALFLGEYYKTGFLSDIFKNIVELLAGIPSVIYGFAALYFLVPPVRWMEMQLGIPPFGVGIMTASIVLAIMIIPYSASVAREVISLTPSDLKEAGFSLGATRYELIRRIIIPHTRSGIMAGVLLALGRAIGETMAVTMVIGNSNFLPKNIFAPSNTMASVIANEFTEATGKVYLSALIEIGLLLFIITTVFNLIGKLYIKRLANR